MSKQWVSNFTSRISKFTVTQRNANEMLVIRMKIRKDNCRVEIEHNSATLTESEVYTLDSKTECHIELHCSTT